MGQIYENAHHIRFSADDSSDNSRVTGESGQCTIRMKADEPDMKDSPQDAPEECSYYHKYVIPEEYTDWMCDKSWPETDSEKSPSEIGEPPLYDKWAQEDDEDEECSSETDNESPEPVYPGKILTEGRIIQMALDGLESLSGPDVLRHMTAITDIINNLEGNQLIESALRGLESYRRLPRLDRLSRIPFQVIRTLLQGIGPSPENLSNVEQWFEGTNMWSKGILKALQAVQAKEESKLREIVHDAIWNGDKGNVVFILRPSIEALSYTDKNKLVVKVLETFESMHSSTRELPDDEDLEMC